MSTAIQYGQGGRHRNTALSFGHRLELIIWLTDTTTGRPVQGARTEFLSEGGSIRYVLKEPGVFGFMGVKQYGPEWTVQAPGFYPGRIRLPGWDIPTPEDAYHGQRPMGGGSAVQVPILEVSLIPGADHPDALSLYTCRGREAGLRAVDAVALDNLYLRISGYDEAARRMALFNPKRSSMSHRKYALIGQENQTYEPFAVAGRLGEGEIGTEDVLQKTFQPGQPIGRLICGKVDEEGEYVIKLRKEEGTDRYLIRLQTDEKETFRLVDLKNIQVPDLAEREGFT